jgi:hypothetical protein
VFQCIAAAATNVPRSEKCSASADVQACASRKSSIFLGRMVSSMFMRVNSKCAHQLRPPLKPVLMHQTALGGR